MRSTHGKSKERIYKIYKGMKTRCSNKNRDSYKNYGGRGIKICEEWLDKDNGFLNFEKWSLENGYNSNLSIDRIDVNGDYSPSNCKWSTRKEQNNNTRYTRKFYVDGQVLSLPEICDKYKLNHRNIYMRLFRGSSIKEALCCIKDIENLEIIELDRNIQIK